MLNVITLHGRLTRDVELRYTQNQKPVATFSVAVDRDYADKSGNRGVDFFNCVAWNGAEVISKYFGKGSQIVVSGRLQNREWQDKDGQKRTATEVVVSTFDFVDKAKAATAEAPEMTEMDDDGELPF